GMAIETRASSANKVEESSNSRRITTRRSLLNSGSGLASGSGLKSSAKEKSLRNATNPSPLNARKSGRLEKQTPTPTGVKRKLERVKTVGPLTRSEKSKEQSSLRSSGLKKKKKSVKSLGSPIVDKGPRKVESMVQLTTETKEVNDSEVELPKIASLMSTSTFFQMSAFEADSESLTTSKATDDRSSDASGTVHEHRQHGDNILTDTASDNDIVLESVENSLVSKRKRNEADLLADNVLVSNKDSDISPTVAVTVQDQPQVNCVSSDCGGDLKRQRVNDEGKQQELSSLNKQSNKDATSHDLKVDGSQGGLHLACNASEVQEVNIEKSIERDTQHDSQKNLHCDLKPKVALLCDVLKLPDDVKCIVMSFLEYVMTNHQAPQKSETRLQAFQIGLCWTAASLLKYKIDHKESLVLAKEQLNFGCKKEEADFFYSTLRCLKKVFLFHHKLSNCVSEDQPKKQRDETQILTASQESLSSSGLQQPLGLAYQDFSRSIKDMNKKCDKEMRKLLEQQAKKKEDLLQKYEKEKKQLKSKQDVEAAVIRLYSLSSAKSDKLKFLDAEYAEKFEKLEHDRMTELKNLEAMQSAQRKNLEERKVKWAEGLESWATEELLLKLPRKDAGRTSETGVSSDVHPKQVPGLQSTRNRDVPSDVREIVILIDDEEEITPMIKSAAEVIHETPSTLHVESTPVEVTSEPLASTGARVDEQDGEILSAESERPVTDQQMKDSSLQTQDEERGTTGKEKAGVGVTNLPHGVEAGLQGEPVFSVPERATTTGLVCDNADGAIEDGEIAGAKEGGDFVRNSSSGSVKLHDTVIPAAEVIHETPSTMHVASIPVEVTSEPLASTSARFDEQGGDIISAESEKPVADQRVKHNSLQSQGEERGTTGREKAGVGVTNAPHDVEVGLQGEPISAVPERATTTGLVDNNPDGEVEKDCEIACAEESGDFVGNLSPGSIKLQNSVIPAAEVIHDTPSTMHFESTPVEVSMEPLASTGVRVDEQGGDILSAESERPVSDQRVKDSSLQSQDEENCTTGREKDEVGLTNLLCGIEAGLQGEPVSAVPERATTTVLVDDGADEEMEDGEIAGSEEGGDSVRNLPSSPVKLQDTAIPAQVVDAAELCEVNNGLSTGVGQESGSSKDTAVHHQDDQSQQIVQTNSTPMQGVVVSGVPDLPSSGEAGLQGELVSAVPERTTTTVLVDYDAEDMEDGEIDGSEEGGDSVRNLSSSPVKLQDTAIPVQEIDAANLCEANNGLFTGVGPESGSSKDTAVHHQDDQSQQIVQMNSTPMQDVVVSGVPDSGTAREVVNVEDLSKENDGLSTIVGRECGSSEDTAVHDQDATVIPPVPEAATTARMDTRTNDSTCRENDLSIHLDNESEQISAQNLAASTASRDDDGSGENPQTNSTSMQAEATVSAEVSPLLLNQPVRDEPLQQQPTSTIVNVSEPVTAPSSTAIGANASRLLQAAPVYRMPLPLGHDPLQNELDRLCRETDQIASLHEKTKLQLRFDCEKEIEEVVAQICRKYEAMAKEKETEFVLSKSELDSKHNKILMNKILADTFRAKCLDSRASNSPVVLQDATAGFMQQFQNLFSQLTQPYTGQRSSTAAPQPLQPAPAVNHQHQTTRSSPQPYTGQRSSTAAPQPLQPAPAVNHQHQPTRSPHPSISRAHHVTHHSPAPTPTPQLSRPLHINTISPTMNSNVQFANQFRAPAPHLQAFRAGAANAPNGLHGMQAQLRALNVHPSTVVPQTSPSLTSTAPSIVPSSAMDAQRSSNSVQQQQVRPNGSQGNSTQHQRNEVVCLSDDE
ncbi:Helicase protein MOM1, partial [Linum perenne]